MTARRVTLKDIAAQARVSVKTVSNVVNGRSVHYSEDTRSRVMKACTRLGYVPNIAARSLRTGRARALALVVPDILNPYFSEIAQHVITEADRLGYTVLVDFTAGDRRREVTIVNGAGPLAVDGIILNPESLQVEDIQPNRVDTPIVLLGERLLDAPHDHVMIDNVAAARLATRHLVQVGRTRIAPVGYVPDAAIGMANLRFRGYREALAEAGLDAHAELEVPLRAPRFSRDDGMEVARRLLELDRPPDALFCFNDLVAQGALQVLSHAGVRVPDDIAIIGFDDITESRYVNPPLSTIAPDKEELSKLAVSLLIQRIEGTRTQKPELITPRFSLVVRGSTVASASPLGATKTLLRPPP